MTKRVSAKKFVLEVEDGCFRAFVDGKEIPSIESFNVAHDAEDNSYDIELYHIDESGYMMTTEVLITF